jgi:DNA-binding transcriptional LysR family regulator
MSLGQCRAIQAIVHHGSFADAARSLNITASTLSMQVSGFEAALGVILFDRASRPPRLTDSGRIVADYAQRIVTEYDAMRGALSLGAAGPALRIGVIPTVVTTLLPAAMMRLQQNKPTPKIIVTTALSGELFDSVDRGVLDTALIHEPLRPRDGCLWQEISQQQVVVIAPPSSEMTDLKQLFRKYPYLRFNRAAWVGSLIEERLRELEISVTEIAEVESVDAIRRLVASGFGVSIVPTVGPSADPIEVRTMSFGEPPLYRRVGFYMREGLANRPALRLLVGAFAEACRSV